AELSVNNNVDRSVLVYSTLPRVDVMEHDYFDIQSVSLAAPTTAIIEAQNFALLYNNVSNYRYVYKLDFDTLEATEYVLGNPANNMQLTASERYAVGVLRPESGTGNSGLEAYQDSRYGLGVIDLEQDQEVSLVLESEPVGTAVVEDDAGSYALLLLDGRDSLLKVDLSAPSAPETIDLEAPPLGIGALPDGRFFITHDSPLGLVSFLDPTDNSITSTAGFGVVDLMADDTLPRRGQEG
ncbi:MAG: hypothetical protein GXP62_12385, partial [Oligoflexia bacterium]|nr:hypothetical protein [Oligoflexia bacterium]